MNISSLSIPIRPEHWERVLLPEVAWFQEGPGVRNFQFTTKGVKLLNGTNIHRGRLNLETTSRYISEGEAFGRYAHFLADPDDIVIASSGITVEKFDEKIALVKKDDIPLCMNTSTIRFKPKAGNLLAEFLIYFLGSSEFKKQIAGEATGSAQLNFGPSHLSKVQMDLPPLAEQGAIAAALSDADALIEGLESLIAKKRAIKHGAMQELLTGRRRLPGFNGEWKEWTFGELFAFLPTATNARSDLSDEGDAAYVHYGDIHTRFHDILDFSHTPPPRIMRQNCPNAATLMNGDWVMADASEDLDGVAKSVEVAGLKDGDVAVSGLHTFLLREKKPTFAPGFKGYLGNAKQLREQFLRVMTGMKVFGVSKTALRDLVIPVPVWEEQEAIRDILNDMSKELLTLETRLAKARQIKQGMMQELLTGRIRLV